MREILFAFWFFLPAGLANAAPVLANRLVGYNKWNAPLDFGLSWRDKQLFGANKTWRGLVAGMILALITIAVQRACYNQSEWVREISYLNYDVINIWKLGVLFGTGSLLGDAVESFFKRQVGVAPGHAWFPFDQIDYIIGGLIFSLPVIRLSVSSYLWIIIVWFGMHLLVSYLSFLLKLKSRPI